MSQLPRIAILGALVACGSIVGLGSETLVDVPIIYPL